MASEIAETCGTGTTAVPDDLRGPVYSSVSLLRAAEIMAFGPVTTGELARALDCHIRTARRALERLLSEGWASRTRGARPRDSVSLRALAMPARRGRSSRSLAWVRVWWTRSPRALRIRRSLRCRATN